jgi:di/tricarboxylate transporter
MAMFIITGVLAPEEGFSGFIHPATIVLGCMFVISAAIFKTGIIDGLSSQLVKLAKVHYIMALLVFCLTTALFSAFVNDAAVVAIMIPMALLVSKETNINPSKLLIPISFAACFGGACTLIGTGTNILISSYAEKSGLNGFGMFEFSKAALVLAGIGFIYLFFVAPFLLPKRKNDNEDTSFQKEAEKYTTEITLLNGNSDINKKISKSKIATDFKAQILFIFRDSREISYALSETLLKENDILKVLITPENLTRLKEEKGISIHGDIDLQNIHPRVENSPEIWQLFEVLIPVGSELASKSLKDLNFRNVYGSSVLAIRHRSENISQNLNNVLLKEGDMLLIYSTEKSLEKLVANQDLFILSNYKKKKTNYKKAIPALLIAAAVVTAAALNLTSILISGMIGCLLLVTTSILKPEEAYQAIDWKVIFMMAGVLSMGAALEKTGGSDMISQLVFSTMGNLDARITLSLVFLVTFLSTNILSSRASAALMTPIVISLASAMQVSERPFLVAVMFACAFTFMTPMCNPTNTMVYAPGNYRFNDYLKVGTPLNIIIWIAASFIIPLFFPF